MSGQARSFHHSERRRREIRTARLGNARDAIGELHKGMEVFILTFGQFSLVDALVYLVDQTGPADVILSTWTAASADLTAAARLIERSRIRRMRFLVDRSFLNRKPAWCAKMRELFGDDCIRTSHSHAKFLTVRNDRWTLAVRTSMNLNFNPRLEDLEVSDDPALCDFLERITDELFDQQAPGVYLDDLPPLEAIPNVERHGIVATGTARTGKAGADRHAMLGPYRHRP